MTLIQSLTQSPAVHPLKPKPKAAALQGLLKKGQVALQKWSDNALPAGWDEKSSGTLQEWKARSAAVADSLLTKANALELQYQQWIRTQIDPLFGAERDQHMLEITKQSGGLLITPYEKMLNRNIAIAVFTSGIAITGKLIFLPLQLACIPLALYLTWPVIQRLGGPCGPNTTVSQR